MAHADENPQGRQRRRHRRQGPRQDRQGDPHRARSSSRVYVEGLNIVKRHQRPRSVKDAQKGGEVGGIIEKEGPIHVSNVMLLDPENNKPTRVRVERGEDGKRKRISAKTGNEID